jgi:hypothetical protein
VLVVTSCKNSIHPIPSETSSIVTKIVTVGVRSGIGIELLDWRQQ